jgi:hypothetical protein
VKREGRERGGERGEALLTEWKRGAEDLAAQGALDQ